MNCGCDERRIPGSRGACFNADRTHRYAWWNCWGGGGLLVSLMLNPSTADENLPDPTVTRNVGSARSWGLGGLEVVNAFSLRSTDPAALMANVRTTAVDPLGALRDALTDEHIAAAVGRADRVLVAWGAHLTRRPLSYRVRELAAIVRRPVIALEITKAGAPKHPLYVRGDVEPVAFAWGG